MSSMKEQLRKICRRMVWRLQQLVPQRHTQPPMLHHQHQQRSLEIPQEMQEQAQALGQQARGKT
jgi:hypothetical protein